MANRSYLYSASKDLKTLRDLSESAQYPFPLTYEIVLGVDTQICNSRIWNIEDKIAIHGNFEKGLQKYYGFLEYLKTQKAFNKDDIKRYEKETKDFFEKHEDRVNDLFFFEPGELIDILSDAEVPIAEQAQIAFRSILRLSKDIDKLLEEKPEDMFTFIDALWMKDLEKDVALIEPYWTHVTYFSFNKS